MIRNFISKLYSLYTPSFFMSGGGSANGYVIERSLRFSAASSQYLTRTFAGDGVKATHSFIVKRGKLGVQQFLFGWSNFSTISYGIAFTAGDALTFANVTGGVVNLQLVTTKLFRDCSAHYHIEVQHDTAQATASERVKIFVNGEQITSFTTATYPAQNAVLEFGTSRAWSIGAVAGSSDFFDGYASEYRAVIGQALTPSSFGEINQSTGQWVAKKYTGTYGTNGFYLDFKDGTSTTTLGGDKSGNANNWTLTSFTRSAGVNDCWMLDVPAGNGSASAVQPSGNYPVWNTLKRYSANFTVSNANLTANDTSSSISTCVASMSTNTSGKYYFEITATSISAANGFIGVAGESSVNSNSSFQLVGSYRSSGIIYNLAGTAQTSGGSYTSGDVIGVAVDVTTGTVQFYKNNVAQGSTPSFTFTAGTDLHPFVATDNTAGTKTFNANFGQRSFAYTPPTGFKALCTANLTSTDVIESGSFTGNASADGPFIWCNGTPETLTINGNAVTWGTHADRLANGFKLRTSSSSYNSSGTNTWTATILSPESKSAFKNQNAKGN